MEHRNYYLVGAFALALALMTFALTPKARAQDSQEMSEHHHKYHPAYETWKQPNSTASCCNARFNEQGQEVGDCESTSFELRNTEKGVQWWAYVPMIKQSLPVPDQKILREKNPDESGRTGHICVNRSTHEVLCAVPPTGAL